MYNIQSKETVPVGLGLVLVCRVFAALVFYYSKFSDLALSFQVEISMKQCAMSIRAETVVARQ